jgi:hypothetical protein
MKHADTETDPHKRYPARAQPLNQPVEHRAKIRQAGGILKKPGGNRVMFHGGRIAHS